MKKLLLTFFILAGMMQAQKSTLQQKVLGDTRQTNPILKNGIYLHLLNQETISPSDFKGANFKANMDSSIAYISSADRTVRIEKGTNSLTSNLTVPSNVTLDFSSGGMISIDSDDTLTIEGAITVPPGQQIFDTTGTVDLSNAKIDAVTMEMFGGGNGVVSGAAMQKALDSGAKRFKLLQNSNYTLDRSLTISSPIVIDGDSATITESAIGDTSTFMVSSNYVTIENLNIKGAVPTDYDALPYPSGFYLADGISDVKIKNVKVTRKAAGIRALIDSNATGISRLKVTDCVFDSVKRGISISGDSNFNGYNSDIIFKRNRVICLYGALTSSRPFNVINAKNVTISDNYGIGGGMAVEMLYVIADSLVDADSLFNVNVSIINNTFDTAISGGTLIHNNTLNGDLIPSGRGFQGSFFSSIEPSSDCIITNNTVKNMPTNIYGVTLGNPNLLIVGNKFINLREGDYGTLNYASKYNTTRTYFNHRRNIQIYNNYFNNVKRPLFESANNSGNTYTPDRLVFKNNFIINTTNTSTIRYVNNLVIENNYFYDNLKDNTSTSGNPVLDIYNADQVSIKNNIFANSSDTLGAAYGVFLNSSATNCQIIMNTAVNMLSGNFYSSSSPSLLVNLNVVDNALQNAFFPTTTIGDTSANGVITLSATDGDNGGIKIDTADFIYFYDALKYSFDNTISQTYSGNTYMEVRNTDGVNGNWAEIRLAGTSAVNSNRGGTIRLTRDATADRLGLSSSQTSAYNEIVSISSSGNVGVGTTTPDSLFDVNGSINIVNVIKATDYNFIEMTTDSTTVPSGYGYKDAVNGTIKFKY